MARNAKPKKCANKTCQANLRQGNDDPDGLCSPCRKEVNWGILQLKDIKPAKPLALFVSSDGTAHFNERKAG